MTHKGFFVVLLNAFGLLDPALGIKQAWRKVVH
jgi:hypothetical protein